MVGLLNKVYFKAGERHFWNVIAKRQQSIRLLIDEYPHPLCVVVVVVVGRVWLGIIVSGGGLCT